MTNKIEPVQPIGKTVRTGQKRPYAAFTAKYVKMHGKRQEPFRDYLKRAQEHERRQGDKT